MTPPSTPASSSFVSLTSLLGTSPAETSLRNFQNGIISPPSPAPSASATRMARPTSGRPLDELLGVSPLVVTWDVLARGATGRGVVDVDGKSIPLEEQRHLSFHDTILSLLQEAERAHRDTNPKIDPDLEAHIPAEDDLYRGLEEFTIQGEDEASNEPTLLHLRTDDKFGPWSRPETRPKTQGGNRPGRLRFTPQHSIDNVLLSTTKRALDTTEVTVGPGSLWHLDVPMNITDEVLYYKDDGEEGSKYGDAPTVTLTLTLRRPHGSFPTLSVPTRGQEQ